MDLNAWLAETKLVVCVGSGGVGKTTTAAAIGLWGAISGRKVLVVTIDPARRLANSLGLQQFGQNETKIDLSGLQGRSAQAAGLGGASGELWALMLDPRHTFDDLIKRIAPNAEVEARILKNHVYRHMSETFAGSQDYMATEKLYDMAQGGKYDLIVLDTPPVKNALDFLESPGRLVHFMDERVLKWFLSTPQEGGIARLMAGTSTVVYWLLGQVFGKDFLDDLAQFFVDFQGLYEGFRQRHEAVLKMFRDPRTGFVTVCAPTEPSVDVAIFFEEALRGRDLPRAGVVVNQVHDAEGLDHDASKALGPLARDLKGELSDAVVNSVLARLGMAHRRLRELSLAEQELEQKLRVVAKGGGFYQRVPRLDGEVHDLRALSEIGRRLFDKAAERL